MEDGKVIGALPPVHSPKYTFFASSIYLYILIVSRKILRLLARRAGMNKITQKPRWRNPGTGVNTCRTSYTSPSPGSRVESNPGSSFSRRSLRSWPGRIRCRSRIPCNTFLLCRVWACNLPAPFHFVPTFMNREVGGVSCDYPLMVFPENGLLSSGTSPAIPAGPGP
jgi:hypothetical protein